TAEWESARLMSEIDDCDTIGIGVGKPSQQEPITYTEHRCARAHAQRKCRHRDNKKAKVLAELSDGESNIPGDDLNVRSHTNLPDGFAYLLDTTKRQASLAQGFRRLHPLFDFFVG